MLRQPISGMPKPMVDDPVIQRSSRVTSVEAESHPNTPTLSTGASDEEKKEWVMIIDHSDIVNLNANLTVDRYWHFTRTKDLPQHTESFFYSVLHGAYDPFKLFGMGSDIDEICKEMTLTYECRSDFVRGKSCEETSLYSSDAYSSNCSSYSTPSESLSPTSDTWVHPSRPSDKSTMIQFDASLKTSAREDDFPMVDPPNDVPPLSALTSLGDSSHGLNSILGISKGFCEFQLNNPFRPSIEKHGRLLGGIPTTSTGAKQAWEYEAAATLAPHHYRRSATVQSWLETVIGPTNLLPKTQWPKSRPSNELQPPASSTTPKTPLDSPKLSCETPSTPWFASDTEISFVLGEIKSPYSYNSDLPEWRDYMGEAARIIVDAYVAQVAPCASLPLVQGVSKVQPSTVGGNYLAFRQPWRTSDNCVQTQIGRGDGGSQVSSITDESLIMGTNATSSSNSTRMTSLPSVGRKRGVPPEGDDESEDDDAKMFKRPRIRKSWALSDQRKILACPYTKFDRQRYSRDNTTERNYHNCPTCWLRDINRLKQHLHRTHQRPNNYCPCCFVVFETAEPLQEHIRTRICDRVDSPFEEKMSPSQMTAIKRRTPGRDPVDLWYDIFKILFPGAPLPLSPYVDSPYQSTVNDFLVFFEVEVQGVLSREVNNRMFGDALATVDPQFLEGVWSESVAVLIRYLDERARGEPPSLYLENISQSF
ncbi:hypothetical protein LTR84_003184 [Exophiala bonariae]|uniref:C2H2-type domain-containing protein n=1 Tax=Exophiala bonariae TaxID=1690606 RepID=A0AAV9N881_9EURO|nr:hypothetical protein LTR84_003184 [Exophiala bonariae]